MRQLALALALGCALVVVMAGSAVARPGPINVVSRAKTVGPARDASIVAECEGRQKALGGGFRSAAGQAFAQAYPEESEPSGDNGWRIQVANNSTTEKRRFHAYAICQRDPGRLTRVVDTRAAPDRANPVKWEAACTNPDQVVGGGFAVGGDGADPNSLDGMVLRSYPFTSNVVRDRWQLLFDPIGLGLKITAIAVCRKKGPALVMRKKLGVTVGPQQAKTVEIRCPADKPKVLSGGFDAQGIPISSYPTFAADAWNVTVVNPGGGSPAKFDAFALCQ